eukprot:jgi/Tetstr1/422928/TSEL_013708.t1
MSPGFSVSVCMSDSPPPPPPGAGGSSDQWPALGQSFGPLSPASWGQVSSAAAQRAVQIQQAASAEQMSQMVAQMRTIAHDAATTATRAVMQELSEPSLSPKPDPGDKAHHAATSAPAPALVPASMPPPLSPGSLGDDLGALPVAPSRQLGAHDLGRSLKTALSQFSTTDSWPIYRDDFLAHLTTVNPVLVAVLLGARPPAHGLTAESFSLLHQKLSATLTVVMKSHPTAATRLRNLRRSDAFADADNPGTLAWDQLCTHLDRRGVARTVRHVLALQQPQSPSEDQGAFTQRMLNAYHELNDSLVSLHSNVLHENVLVAATLAGMHNTVARDTILSALDAAETRAEDISYGRLCDMMHRHPTTPDSKPARTSQDVAAFAAAMHTQMHSQEYLRCEPGVSFSYPARGAPSAADSHGSLVLTMINDLPFLTGGHAVSPGTAPPSACLAYKGPPESPHDAHRLHLRLGHPGRDGMKALLRSESVVGGAKFLLGVIDHYSNYIWLAALPSKRDIITQLRLILLQIRTICSKAGQRRFAPSIKFDCDPNYLDTACRHAIGNKWVFKVKANSDGSVNRFKARLAAQGFSQQAGVDYHATFSPVVKLSTLRTCLAVAAARGMHIPQIDIETAFPNASLKEEIYMRQPKGAEDGSDNVLRLLKSIYGLKQASREWYELIHKTLTGLGLARSNSDTSMYSMNHPRYGICIVLVYVDDILVVSDSVEWIRSAKSAIGAEFNMTDFGEAAFVLGMDLTRCWASGTIRLSQEQ